MQQHEWHFPRSHLCIATVAQAVNFSTSGFADIQVKELNKRASGHAFELILRPTSPDAKVQFPLSPVKKKETSLDEILKKLEAADERRKVSTTWMARKPEWTFDSIYLINCGGNYQLIWII